VKDVDCMSGGSPKESIKAKIVSALNDWFSLYDELPEDIIEQIRDHGVNLEFKQVEASDPYFNCQGEGEC
jgi:hypothetical protein